MPKTKGRNILKRSDARKEEQKLANSRRVAQKPRIDRARGRGA
jgi:hypothetical protein